jgi:D-glycero-alpha-D-manno-heptose-7-phosphate kinase
MVISRTPFRMSFFGGGTDYPAWYRKEGGSVLSATINKYCYITCRRLPPFFDTKHRIVWSHIECANSPAEILHPAIREALRSFDLDPNDGLEIHHQGDLPARSGIGSSSSFSVGMIHALLGFRGKMISKKELALKAIDFEQNVLKECVGCQDQLAVSYGGINRFNFFQNGDIQRHPVLMEEQKRSDLEKRLLLFYLGTNRLGSELAARLVANMSAKTAVLHRMHEMVDEANHILQNGKSLDCFGELLHEAWLLKQSLAEGITTPAVQAAYETARAHGAVGGKLMGAGGTGFMYFYVPPEKQPSVREALAHLLHVPFTFEREGSTIIHYDRD